MRSRYWIIFIISCLISSGVSAQTIAEKKAQVTTGLGDLRPELQQFLNEVNQELKTLHRKLHDLYATAAKHYREEAEPEVFQELLVDIREVKQNIQDLEQSWLELVVQSGIDQDAYALWHQPATTLEELVVDYGSADFVYLIPPEVASIQLSVSSNIPIPRSSWNSMLVTILRENGVGVQQLNPFLRRLYLLSEDHSNFKVITVDRQDLEIYPERTRVSFVLTPEPSELNNTWGFLQKFVNPKSTSVEIVGRNILIIGEIASVKELLRIFDFVSEHRGELDYKAIALHRLDPEDMARILSTMFEQLAEEPVEIEGENGTKISKQKRGVGGALRVIPLTDIARALFLIGTKKEIKKAEEIITDVENQVGLAREKEVYRYTVKHSDPEELAEVISKVYYMMLEEGVGFDEQRELQLQQQQQQLQQQQQYGEAQPQAAPSLLPESSPPDQSDTSSNQVIFNNPGNSNFNPLFDYQNQFLQGGFVVNPRPAVPGGPTYRETNVGRDNFIVDLKSSSIVMVVESSRLPRLKELLKKIDIPKKMVQVEVLLFEKKLNRKNEYGLNLLKLGSKATETCRNDVCWNNTSLETGGSPFQQGIFEFMLSRKNISSCIPGFDVAYRFLMTQDDITINSAPSVVAVNQTPATININEEISLKTGAYPVQTNGTVVPADTFTRAQYGTTITVVPTIHMHDEEDYYEYPTDYITLDTDITFDTIDPSILTPQQPNVNRRHITNQVRIADGQTVILGGLRRKQESDGRESIPFLGEIPGIGKLFSTNKLEDRSTDMYIFLTPTIISEPIDDFTRVRREQLCRRPGDIPEFLCCLNAAREFEKNRLMQGTMTMLFGRLPDRCIQYEGIFYGR